MIKVRFGLSHAERPILFNSKSIFFFFLFLFFNPQWNPSNVLGILLQIFLMKKMDMLTLQVTKQRCS